MPYWHRNSDPCFSLPSLFLGRCAFLFHCFIRICETPIIQHMAFNKLKTYFLCHSISWNTGFPLLLHSGAFNTASSKYHFSTTSFSRPSQNHFLSINYNVLFNESFERDLLILSLDAFNFLILFSKFSNVTQERVLVSIFIAEALPSQLIEQDWESRIAAKKSSRSGNVAQ